MDKYHAQRMIRFFVWVLVLVVLITLGLAWWQYPEPYEFFQQYISALGRALSKSDLDNTVSSYTIMSGFFLIALIGLIIIYLYITNTMLDFRKIKITLTALLSIGAIGVGVPVDKIRLIHYIGTFLFLTSFSLLIFVWQVLRFTRRFKEKRDKKTEEEIGTFGLTIDIASSILLFVVIIVNLVAFVFDRAGYGLPYITGELMQKIVLFVAIFSLIVLDKEDM